jgi:hypothetical protein
VEEIELRQLSAGEFRIFSPTPNQLAVSPVLPYENAFLRDY